jgi:hypothetical protein
MLAPVAKIVRHYRDFPNVTGYLEPHNELEHNMPAIFADVACIYINGRRLNRSAGMMRGHHFRMNLMPWIKWDEPNEVEIEAGYRGPHDVMNITHIEVRYYDPS